MKTEILPSLLAADFGRLADEILRAESSGAEALHLDVMDAHFVPNLSFGPDVAAKARAASELVAALTERAIRTSLECSLGL